MLTAAAVVALLIAVNALYVAAEFAAVAARRTRVEQLASEGNLFARSLLASIPDARGLDTYVAACQIGITLSSLILGAYGQATIGTYLSGRLQRAGGMDPEAALALAAAITLGALVVTQVILGELLPKSVAVRYPVAVALATALPMQWSIPVLAPFILLLNGSASLILRAFHVPPEARTHIHAAEEIDFLVEESHEGGMLDDAEHERLHNVLRLTNSRVKEVMIPRTRVFAIPIDTSPAQLMEIATDSAYTRTPVYEGSLDNVLGLLHVKDLLAQTASDDEENLVGMLRDMMRVLETTRVVDLLSDMRSRHQQMALVVDEYGGTSGIVTLEDLLEEVVGEIPDEYDKGHTDSVVHLGEGVFRAPGTLPLRDLREEAGVDVEFPASDTVGGLVMGLLGRMPLKGDVVTLEGWRIEVEEVDGHSTESVLIARTERGEADE